MRTQSLLVGVLAVVSILAACRAADGPIDGRARLDIVFSNANASQIILGAHVSIVDSLFVTVSAGGGTEQQTFARRLATTDSVVQLPVTAPLGDLSVDARVISRAKTVLYRGTARGTVTTDGFSLNVPLAAQGPVLAVSPDAMRLATRFDTLLIHNRGTGSLVFTTTYRGNPACNPNSCVINVSPNQGSVTNGRPIAVVVSTVNPSNVTSVKTINDLLLVVVGADTLRIPVRSP